MRLLNSLGVKTTYLPHWMLQSFEPDCLVEIIISLFGRFVGMRWNCFNSMWFVEPLSFYSLPQIESAGVIFVLGMCFSWRSEKTWRYDYCIVFAEIVYGFRIRLILTMAFSLISSVPIECAAKIVLAAIATAAAKPKLWSAESRI